MGRSGKGGKTSKQKRRSTILMYLIKTKSGTYSPMDSSDHDESKKIPVGEAVKATKARNVGFHKKGFALLKLAHDNQDKYESFDVFRKVLTIRAGFYDEIEDKNGDPYFIPKSLAFDKMSAEAFEQWFDATLKVISEDLQTAPEDIRAEVEGYY